MTETSEVLAVAKEMRRAAGDFDLRKKVQEKDLQQLIEQSRRVFDYKGHKIRVLLTVDTLSESKWAWHFSVSFADKFIEPVPTDVVRELVDIFLPGSIEVPSVLFPGVVRQFVRIEDQENGEVNIS